jgi:hypothetical protein
MMASMTEGDDIPSGIATSKEDVGYDRDPPPSGENEFITLAWTLFGLALAGGIWAWFFYHLATIGRHGHL